MCRKWVQKTCFAKPKNAQLNRVLRIISSDPYGIYSVKWLHLYRCAEGLVSVESGALSTVEDEECRFVDSSGAVETLNQRSFTNQSEADSYFSDWEYDQCKCDGGYSGYHVRSVRKHS